MTITKSELLEATSQKDGRKSVLEEHTDDKGKTYRISYVAEAGANVEKRMNDRVPELEAQLAKEAVVEANAPLLDSAVSKLNSWVKNASSVTVKTQTTLTDAELAVLRAALE